MLTHECIGVPALPLFYVWSAVWAWVTEELEQFLYYSEQHNTEHLGRHDELCHLPRPFDLIQGHYISRLQTIDRNSGRARAEMQELNRDLVRDEAQRARVAQVAAAAATMAMVAAAAAPSSVVRGCPT
jgi:hypothetical protein